MLEKTGNIAPKKGECGSIRFVLSYNGRKIRQYF